MNSQQVNLIGAYAGLLSLTEIGLGSILHALRIPFRGQLLSLNQIFLLMRASYEGGSSRFSPASISNIAAILKSLSPIGNKLTPMLAISMQGWLFTIGTAIFGHSLIGRLVGGIISSLWAFAQPILIYSFIFGSSGKQVLDFGLKEITRLTPITQEMIYGLALGIVIAKVLLVIAMGCFVRKLPESWIAAYTQKMTVFPSKAKKQKIYRPLFLFFVLLTGLYFFFRDGSYASMLWHLLQPLALGFILFFGMRMMPLDRLAARLEKKNSPLGEALRLALQRVRSF